MSIVTEDQSGTAVHAAGEAGAHAVRLERHVTASGWRRLLGPFGANKENISSPASTDGREEYKTKPEKWSMGVLNDKQTDEVPGMWHQNGFAPRQDPRRCCSCVMSARHGTSHVQGLQKE